jgi:hypothetical protein
MIEVQKSRNEVPCIYTRWNVKKNGRGILFMKYQTVFYVSFIKNFFNTGCVKKNVLHNAKNYILVLKATVANISSYTLLDTLLIPSSMNSKSYNQLALCMKIMYLHIQWTLCWYGNDIANL